MLTYIFVGPEEIAYIVELGASLSDPVNLYIHEDTVVLTLEVGETAWYLIDTILSMLENSDDELTTHQPIVEMVAAIHWACIAKPHEMGVK